MNQDAPFVVATSRLGWGVIRARIPKSPRRLGRATAANVVDCPFPPENLPYGVFSVDDAVPHLGVAIGDQVLDLASTCLMLRKLCN